MNPNQLELGEISSSNIIAKIIFPSSYDICSEKELYFRDNGGVDYSEKRIKFSNEASLSLFSYYNSISYSKLAKYCGMREILFSFKLKGKIRIKIKAAIAEIPNNSAQKELNFANFTTLVIYEGIVTGDGTKPVFLPIDFSKVEGEGILYPEIEGEKGAEISDLMYLSTIPSKRESKIGIVFCTFKREKYVSANVKRINMYLQEDFSITNKFGIFVIDNGKTLKEEEIEGAMLFPNANTGGSGGFTRGIKEVCSRKEYSHFLLMDDDIKFEPEVLRRILFWTENSLSPERLTIGGTMLIAENPTFQYEMGAVWNAKNNLANKFAYNVKCKRDLVRNEVELNSDYNAWWCCCMPVSTVDRIGLPLQLFIKGDDIEYSLRAQNQILLTNGIAVWHESFTSKYSSELEYYIKRNELIVNSIHRRNFGRVRELTKLIRSVAKQLVFHRYDTINDIFLAYDHFLKGATFFSTIDSESLHKELRSRAIKQFSKEELKQKGYDIEGKNFYKIEGKKKSYLYHALTLNGYLIRKERYPKEEKDSFRLINMISSTPRSMFKADCTVQYNPNTQKGFFTRLDRSKLFYSMAGILRISIKMLVFYGRVANSYKKLEKK